MRMDRPEGTAATSAALATAQIRAISAVAQALLLIDVVHTDPAVEPLGIELYGGNRRVRRLSHRFCRRGRL